MSCTVFAANTAIQELMWCAITNSTGGTALAVLLMFILLLYGMYQFKIPFAALVPVGIVLISVFAGAGAITSVAGTLDTFSTIMMMVIAFIGIIVFLAFWRLKG